LVSIVPQAHCTDVEDDHADVVHPAKEICAVDEKSYCAKFNPVTVTELPPLRARLVRPDDATAASNVYSELPVPATAPTVICSNMLVNATACGRHVTAVELDHVAVVHSAPDSLAVTENTSLPKFKPVTVTEDDPLDAAFVNPNDAVGASKVNFSNVPVPATAPTVT
jgi:hypothetical protein